MRGQKENMRKEKNEECCGFLPEATYKKHCHRKSVFRHWQVEEDEGGLDTYLPKIEVLKYRNRR